MAEVRMHANRCLRRRALPDGSRRGVDGYFSIVHGERPTWWGDVPEHSEALGVFENVAGSDEDALIIDPTGITVRSQPRQQVTYADIAELVPPRKQPFPTAIECRMRDGRTCTLPVHRREGQVMDIYRFLLAATGEFTSRH